MLSSLFSAAAGAGVLAQSGAIVAATFVVEDAATVMVGILCATGQIPLGAALGALYAGIAVGDVGLYGLGNFASRHRWARRLVPMEAYDEVQRWLRQHLFATVATTRFLPGMRLPVYTACGFLHMPLARFAAIVAAATFVWTTLLFGAAYAFGAWAAQAIGVWRWPLGLVLAATFIFGARVVAQRMPRAALRHAR
jgi:membrane protein DedA with SNARE-associated domain